MNRVVSALSLLVVLGSAAVVPVSLLAETCVQSHGHTSDGQDLLPLNFGGATTDLWNLRSAVGGTQICHQNSGLHTTVEMRDINGSDGVHVVVAYPHIGYGFGEFDTSFGRVSPALSFPMAIDTFESSHVAFGAAYSLAAASAQPFNFAYDLWIEGAPQPAHRALLSDLEVMVWLYNQTMRPAGTFEGTFLSGAQINGKQTNATWSVFATMPSPSIRTLVTYLLTPSMKSGSISVRLGDFITEAIANYWHPTSQSYYLMGVELGTEFEAPGNRASLVWSVSSMAFKYLGGTIEILG